MKKQNNKPTESTCAWLLENFPVKLKAKVKAEAARRHITLRQFVVDLLVAGVKKGGA